MNVIIVCWNIQGKYSLAQLIDRLIANGWSMLIVLEPQQVIGRTPLPTYTGVTILSVNVGDQNVYVLHNEEIASCQLTPHTVMSGERSAVLVEIQTYLGARYRILTAHAPYRSNDGTAAQYQSTALSWAAKNNIDVVLGDLNTYGSKVGSSSRSNFRNISEGLATSKGGNQLDKALVHDNYYGLPDFHAGTMALSEIEIPETSLVQTGSRASSRESVAQSRQGRHKTSDHQPMILSLPAAVLHSKGSFSSMGSSSGGTVEIKDDGHCLYRAIAQIMWGDQERYLEVRRALADHIRANWSAYPYLQHLATLNQLTIYESIVRNTAAWGGEFEIAVLAQIYNLRITLQSPHGYAQAVYGNGATAATLRHTGAHFEVG